MAASSSSSPSSPRLVKRPRLSSSSLSSCCSSRPSSSFHLSRHPPPLSLESEDSSTGSSTCCLSPSSSSTCTSAMRVQLDDTFNPDHYAELQQQQETHEQRLHHEMDITCFFLLDDACDGGLGFDPDTVFHHDAALLPSDDDNDAAFVGCSAENGNWFLHDLDSEGNAFLDEVLDQEWMAAAVANLDRINETLDSDSCVLHLLESGAGS